MKLRTYFITLIAFSMNHALRIALPYNKSQVQLKYNVDDLFLGVMDVISFLMYAIGACFHFKIVNRNNLKQTYLKIAILATISGCFFAYFSLFFEDHIFEDQVMDNFAKKFILILNICIYGFCSFSVWPINLSLVSQYYKPETDGGMIGLWGAGWELGNILSLLVSNYMVYSLNLRWQTTVLIFAIFNLTGALMIYFFLNNPTYGKNNKNSYKALEGINIEHQSTQNQNQILQQSKQFDETKINQKAFLEYVKNLFKSKQLRVYLLINGITSSIFTFFLYWIPIYMVSIKYEHVSGYVTLIFQVFAIIGSFFLGMFHQNNSTSQRNNLISQNQISQVGIFQKAKKSIFNNMQLIATVVNIIVLITWILIEPKIEIYAVMIGILGFFMGGLFNSMHSNDLFIYTQNDPIKTQMFAVVILISNYILTALSFLLLGFLIHYSHRIGFLDGSQSQYKCVIHVSLVLTVIKLGFFILKRVYSEQSKKTEKQPVKLN